MLHEYIPGIDPDFPQEIIFNLINYHNSKLILGVTTGLMAKALQRGYKNPTQNPIVIQGLLLTRDNRLVLGVRSKPSFRDNLPDEFFDHKIMFCPAGYATFNADGNLQKPFYKELREELGLTKDDITEIRMLGHNKDEGFTEGIRIFFYASTNLTFDDVVKRWKKAPHCWEYEDLIGIKYNKESIKKLLTTGDFSTFSEKANGLIASSVVPVLKFI